MKRSLILVLLCTGALTMSGIPSNVPEAEAVAQFDKSTMINKKLRSAQESMDKGDYQSAINTLNSLLKLSPSHSKAKEMLDQCKQGVKQQKAREEQAFKDACKSGSTDALNDFIRRYPNSEHVKAAKQRLDDYSIWEIAKKRNTIDSYNLYLQKSSVLAYKEDAQVAIKKIKADQAWSICMNTENESLLNDFISTYPESPNIEEARYRLNLLKGERMYRDGFTDMAYFYLSDANLHRTLTGEAAVHYAELKDKKTFNEMLASSDIDKVRGYLNTLSVGSPYYNDISNHLALLLGAKLSAWSAEYNMNEALSYAKDESTKATVKKYINQAKDLHRTYERQSKARRRKAWWRERITLGWNIFNIGTNSGLGGNKYKDLYIIHLGTGLRLRFGRYSDVINIIFGADYQYNALRSDAWIGDRVIDNLDIHQGIGIANIRFNILEASKRSKFYIGCAGNFCFISSGKNVDEKALNKNPIAIEPQIGIESKNIDFGVYFRTYTDKNSLFVSDIVGNNYLGCFFTWYF